MHIGKSIIELRKRSDMTQAELANGICKQSQISKIEQGKVIPSALILYEISKKMGVDLNYFFEYSETPRLDYLKELKYQIKRAIRKRDYQEVFDLVRVHKKHPLTKSYDTMKYLEWHEGICEYYIHGNAEKALKSLNNILSKDNMKMEDIEILNSIGIIYSETGKLDAALKIFQEALYFISKCVLYTDDPVVSLKIYYNTSKTYTKLKNYQKSIHYCDLGIKLCIERDLMYLLGEFYYQKGINYIHIDMKETGLEHLNHAVNIFQLTGNEQFSLIILQEIEELKDPH